MAKAKENLFTDFEQYRLTQVQLTDKKLGHGSHATVVEVKYMGLKCAGKMIHKVLLPQGDTSYAVQRFAEECYILSCIRHPNIVQFLGVHFREKERIPMLVMEFLPMNLTSCIEKHDVLPETTAYSILHDVALGLCYLHGHKPPIIHRDLSSNNVLLTHNMDAKISDLGVSKMLDLTPLQASRMTETPGTPAYMPPEVMVANPKYDTSIDEFSFGILMIHILSGNWPEPQCSQIRVKGSQMIPITEAERRQCFLQVIGNDHPLMKLILKCINNNPKQRSHVTEISQRLSKLVSKLPPKHSQLEEMELKTATSGKKADKDTSPRRTKHLVEKHPISDADKKREAKCVSYQKGDESCSSESSTGSQSKAKTKKHKHLQMKPKLMQQCEKKALTNAMVELEVWYFGNIDCILAVNKCKEDGDFLVRYSVSKQQYVITCQWKGTCRNYLIQQDSSGQYIDSSGVYNSVKELIAFYIKHDEPLSDIGDRLLHPVSKYDKWNVPYDGIQVLKSYEAASHCGNFGEALFSSTGENVTVKIYSGDSPRSMNEFLLEAEVLKRCYNPNVTQLLGVCVDPNPKTVDHPVYIIMEHMQGGMLLQYLKERGSYATKKQLCRMCADVCKGLQYVHTRLLRAHCDVGARSCLVGDHDVVKVSNLGKSICFNDRTEYKHISETIPLPIKWSAPETFINHKIHLSSDVWSFGVLLWETFSIGTIPYPGMDDETVLSKVKDGYKMDPPEDCPREITSIMLECWQYSPTQRPNFATLLQKLQQAHLKIKSHIKD